MKVLPNFVVKSKFVSDKKTLFTLSILTVLLSGLFLTVISAQRTQKTSSEAKDIKLKGIFVDVNSIGGPCNDNYTKQQAKKPSTPWCNLQLSIQKLRPGNTLILRAGSYKPENPEGYLINKKASENLPITIKNYPGENPIISGKRSITNWNLVSNSSDIYVLDLSGTNISISGDEVLLFQDDVQLSHARFPTRGSFRATAGGKIRGDGAFLIDENNLEEKNNYWVGCRVILQEHPFDYHRDTIDRSEGATIYTSRITKKVKKGQSYTVDNCLQVLNDKGEFWYDSTNRKIYIKINPTNQGVNPKNYKMEVSYSTSLLSINQAEFIYISGLTFEASTETGIVIKGGKGINFYNNVIQNIAGDGLNLDVSPRFGPITNCQITGNTFKNIGITYLERGHAVVGAKRANHKFPIDNCKIQGNNIDTVGHAGITFGGRKNSDAFLRNSLISDNTIKNTYANSISLVNGKRNIIEKNIIISAGVDTMLAYTEESEILSLGGTGIRISNGGNNTIRHNSIIQSGGASIVIGNSSNNKVYFNSTYHSLITPSRINGLEIIGSSVNNDIRNNIFSTYQGPPLVIDIEAINNNIVNYNDFYWQNRQYFALLRNESGDKKLSFRDFQNLSGQCTHCYRRNPKFALRELDGKSHLLLSPSSPVIDAGIVVDPSPYFGKTPDLGAVEYKQ